MDFLTEILIAFIVGVIFYYGLIRAKVVSDNALIFSIFIGGWVFAQLPNFTRENTAEGKTYSTLRSYLVGFILLGVVANKFLPLPVPKGGKNLNTF